MSCSFPGCEAPARRRTGMRLCNGHYHQNWKGRPLTPIHRTLEERFWSKVDQTDPSGCWLWKASIDKWGYGVFYVPGLGNSAHRVSYQLLVGPIPDGLTIDHLCRVTACVNPAHLEPVTMTENIRRRIQWRLENITSCAKGHPFDDANTYFRQGSRHCRACQREAAERYKQKKAGLIK